MPPWDSCIVPDRMGLAPPPEEAKQHTNPSRHQERLEGPLVELDFYGPVQILKALAPLLVDLGPRRLHGLLSLSPHVLHCLFDLSPYILHLCAQCLRLVMTLSPRHGCVRTICACIHPTRIPAPT